jgi:putative ABC transport system substrate-binding protein
MRTVFVSLTAAFLLATAFSTATQPPARVPRIGCLGAVSVQALVNRLEGFRLGLCELGYEEGKNIAVEYRYADGKFERLPALATKLVNSRLALVVTHGGAAVNALKRTDRNIPIVVELTGDLALTGRAASFARLGGNVTGFVDTRSDLSEKRLELIKEVQSKTSRIAILWNAGNPVKALDFKKRTAARALGLRLQSWEVKAPQDFAVAFKILISQPSGALRSA